MAKNKQPKFYAIREGRQAGIIVGTWDECKRLVDGYPGAKYKSFRSEKEAQKYLDDATPMGKIFIDHIADQNPEARQIDGHDEACIGTCFLDDEQVLVYSYRLIIHGLMKMGMDLEDAREYYDFNIENGCQGPGCPFVIDDWI